MKVFYVFLVFSFSNSFALTLHCEGVTNDKNASENPRFELAIKTNDISTLKIFYSTHVSFTGIDISDQVSVLPQKITFKGSIASSRNLTINFNKENTLQNIVMNYDSKIVNQTVTCDGLESLPPRPTCSNITDTSKALLDAIINSNTDAIETALICGANINAVDKNGCTPLMFVVDPTCGYKSSYLYSSLFSKTGIIMDMLTSNGAFVNVADTTGETPLIKAAKNKIENVYSTFIGLEADFDSQDHLGNTALMYAVLTNNKAVVEQLLEGNPDRSIENKAGETAYAIAKRWQNEAVADLVRIADSSFLIQGQGDGTCSPLQLTFKQGQVVDLTLKATEKMFKLLSPALNLDLMADRNSTSKKTVSFENKGKFKFSCGFHGSNKPTTGTIFVE